jgi:hypothetical protein
MRHTIVEEETHVGAGKDRTKEKRLRAITLVELLYNAKLIDLNTLMAADRFRTLYLEREGPSQGVGSYGDASGRSDPATKGDRVGKALTGVSVNWRKGTAMRTGRPGLTNSYDYEAALLAMCGVIDVEGKRVHDDELKRIMVAAIVQTTDIPTQGNVARLRTRYTGEKQLPPAGATVITEALRRLALHLRYGG